MGPTSWEAPAAVCCAAVRRSGRRSQRRIAPAWGAVSGLGAALLTALAATADPDASEARLEALMRGMATTSGVTARFREQKELALLSAPLESKGLFVFVPPDRLNRVTETPSPSRLVIDGDRVSYEGAGDAGSMDLSANPVARQYVENLVVLFAGDLPALRRRYRLRFEAEAEGGGWRLELVPRGEPLSSVIERVTLEGRAQALERMELLEVGGDRTTTWFEEVRSDVELSAEEIAELFSAPGPAGSATGP